MKKSQEKDLETVRYFIPTRMKKITITSEDIKKFFEWSEHGKHKNDISSYAMDGFNALVQGKAYRGIHVGMYEEGVLDGSTPYCVIFENAPRSVIEFMSKEMFRGVEKSTILNMNFDNETN